MRVLFDKQIKIAGIGMAPWSRLGPEQWLPNYAIASLYDWDLPDTAEPPVFALDRFVNPLPALDKINTPSLLRTAEFRRLLDEKLPGYDLLTYKPTDIPQELSHRRFLTVPVKYTAIYENKATFRELFAGSLPFPAYRIVERSAMLLTQEYYELLRKGRHGFIIQDEQLSGGKGSFVVRDFDDYIVALRSLAVISKHERVVISDLVASPRELSIQCCVTKYGVFTGPLQQQLVADPALALLSVGGDKFCGVQVDAALQGTQLHVKASAIAQQIGQKLQSDGYTGIFGVDYLADKDDHLFVLEVNPRITGATPLLAALADDDAGIPFYLLHLLELGGYDYTIEDTPVPFARQGSLLMVHSLEDSDTRLVSMPGSGHYRLQDGLLVRVGDSIRLRDASPGECIIQEYIPASMKVRAGGRIAVLYVPFAAFGKDGSLTSEARAYIDALRADIRLETIDI